MLSEQDKMISKEFLELLEETMEKVYGYYLDKGYSLMEILNKITASEASKKQSISGESIASHVEHTRFYMQVFYEYMTGQRSGKTDWSLSWLINQVTDEEWAALKKALLKGYTTLKNHMNQLDSWQEELQFDGVLSILIHTAFHLGVIRQMAEKI